MKLASIIIPYYKKRNYIKKTIKSVLNQSYKNFEVIIIYDDEDKTDLHFLKNIFNKNKKIKIVVNKKNIGAGLSRNKGIKIAKGRYIAFIDADDQWKKNKLSIQINFMEKNNISVSHTSYEIINNKGSTIYKRKAKNFLNYEKLLSSCDIGLSTVIMEKKIFSHYCKFPNTKTKEDFILWIKILKRGYKIYALDQFLSIWKKTPNSLSSSTLQKLKDGFNIYNKFLKFNFFKSILYLTILSLNFLKKNT